MYLIFFILFLDCFEGELIVVEQFTTLKRIVIAMKALRNLPALSSQINPQRAALGDDLCLAKVLTELFNNIFTNFILVFFSLTFALRTLALHYAQRRLLKAPHCYINNTFTNFFSSRIVSDKNIFGFPHLIPFIECRSFRVFAHSDRLLVQKCNNVFLFLPTKYSQSPNQSNSLTKTLRGQ